jgi:hypothetical protein
MRSIKGLIDKRCKHRRIKPSILKKADSYVAKTQGVLIEGYYIGAVNGRIGKNLTPREKDLLPNKGKVLLHVFKTKQGIKFCYHTVAMKALDSVPLGHNTRLSLEGTKPGGKGKYIKNIVIMYDTADHISRL